MIVAATVAVGAGLMIVVGLDGSPAWQLLRLVLVAAVTAATYNALRHGDARRRAGVAFSVGLVGTTVGAGIGLPHLAKAGVHLLTVAGLFSLAGGLVLLTWGGVALVRSARPWSALRVRPSTGRGSLRGHVVREPGGRRHQFPAHLSWQHHAS